MKELFDKLKEHLVKTKDNYVEHYDMAGSTETGFWEEDHFDMEALLAEIDKFSEEFKEKK